MKQINVKKLILPNIPYVFIALLATKVSEAVRLAPGSDASTKLLNLSLIHIWSFGASQRWCIPCRKCARPCREADGG